ncbi:hypothetical protein AB0B63_07220 [Micromonospora sp. NPDC049081]|uniref:hypothetical protein n=1 Tax=Micromonospora sp. NPDC049081 TaxID=3155150 RepID=UPI0033F8886D
MATVYHFMRYDSTDPTQCEDAARFLDESAEQPGNAGDPDRMRTQAANLRQRAGRLRSGQQD